MTNLFFTRRVFLLLCVPIVAAKSSSKAASEAPALAKASVDTESWSMIELISLGHIFQVPERHVGVCFYAGALMEHLYEPGRHWKWHSLWQRCTNVPVGHEKEVYRNLECGARGTDEPLVIPEIRVRYKLPKEHVLATLRTVGPNFEDEWIESEIENFVNTMCSNMTVDDVFTHDFAQIEGRVKAQLIRTNQGNGLQILDVNVPRKPPLPPEYQKGYKARAAALTAEDEKRKKLVEAQTEAERKKIEAESKNALEILAAQKDAEMRQIGAAAAAKQLRLEADAQAYAILQKAEAEKQALVLRAEANQRLLTDAYLRTKELEAWGRNKVTFLPDKVALHFWQGGAGGNGTIGALLDGGALQG